MRFAHPEWLATLAGACALAALVLLLGRLRGARRLRGLLGEGVPPAPARGDLLRLGALLAVALALAGPQCGERVVRVPASGVDLVLLVDVSRSMQARDVPPSRLERARQAAREVLERLAPGDRAALAAFAGRGVLLTPLTPDKQALVDLLPALDPELMSAQGSRLRSGVRAALAAFPERSARPRLLLVLGDGEAPRGDRPTGAAEAARAGARVVVVAIGDERGATIPDPPGELRDAEGETVVTRRDASRLAALAEATDGVAFAADRWGAVDPARVVAALRRDATAAPDGFVERRVAVTHFVPFAALALALLLGEALVGLRAPGARRLRRPAAGAVAALSLLLLGAGVGELGSRALLELGVRRAEAGDLEGAEHAFFAAAVRAREAGDAADAHFDLGVAALARQDFARARDAFFDAIALAPDDREAQFNLEWTLRRLAARPPSGPPPPRPGPEPGASEADEGEGEGRGEAERAERAERAPSDPDDREREAREGAESERRPAPAPALDPEEAQRWLGVVVDDPGRALRSALEGDAGGPSRSAPGW